MVISRILRNKNYKKQELRIENTKKRIYNIENRINYFFVVCLLLFYIYKYVFNIFHHIYIYIKKHITYHTILRIKMFVCFVCLSHC